ncbi:hypothetical protein B0H13DRAFT_1850900 [Mycena leptocephala]|nr:hypothetical protein B0H13DRAFT_1850900 [Mycena leptocephala]
MAATARISVASATALAKLEFLEVLNPNWRSDEKKWYKSLSARERNAIKYIRVRGTHQSSARIPDYTPWDFGISIPWLEENQKLPENEVLLADWNTCGNPAGFDATFFDSLPQDEDSHRCPALSTYTGICSAASPSARGLRGGGYRTLHNVVVVGLRIFPQNTVTEIRLRRVSSREYSIHRGVMRSNQTRWGHILGRDLLWEEVGSRLDEWHLEGQPLTLTATARVTCVVEAGPARICWDQLVSASNAEICWVPAEYGL